MRRADSCLAPGKTDESIEGFSDPSYVYGKETGTLFNFHVFSKDTGFWDSVPGTDDDSRDVMSTCLAVSDDNGEPWNMSEPVGSVVGENKVVELSEGTRMKIPDAQHLQRPRDRLFDRQG